jgi:hypothetical protein
VFFSGVFGAEAEVDYRPYLAVAYDVVSGMEGVSAIAGGTGG